MKKATYIFFVFLFMHTLAYSQNGTVYYMNWVNSERAISSVNLVTGQEDTIGNLDGVIDINTSTSTFDDQEDNLIVITNLGVTLFDVTNGSIVNSYPVASGLNLIEYYNDKTYSLVDAGNEWHFYSMDLTSGVENMIGTLDDISYFQSGTSTFNHDEGHFMFLSNLGVTIVDVTDGSIVNTIPVPLTLSLLEYHDSKCYGVSWIDDQLNLLSVDLITGITDTVGLLDNITSYTAGTTTMDRTTGTFMFIGNASVTLVDINDASIKASYPVDFSLSVLEYQMGVSTSINTAGLSSEIIISPNPSAGHWIIQMERNYSQVTLSVNSVDGRLLTRQAHENVDQVRLDLEAPAGVYFLSVQTESGQETFLLKLVR